VTLIVKSTIWLQ